LRKKGFNKETVWNLIMYVSIILAIFTIVVAALMPFAVRGWYRQYDDYSGLVALGPVGDFIGGTTIAFFNFSSFLLLLVTLLMQRKELKETRDEYKLTNDTMRSQLFDNTFFNMITLHNEIVSSIKFGSSSNERVGRDAIRFMYDKLTNIHNNPPSNILGLANEASSEYERLKITYSYHFEFFENQLGHYFRNLYRIVKWIDNSDLDFDIKKQYIGILRAQLSIFELKLLFYNALNKKGEDFKGLILKYNFFDDHLEPEDLIEKSHFNLLIDK
jgi:uncharacterized membrane protein